MDDLKFKRQVRSNYLARIEAGQVGDVMRAAVMDTLDDNPSLQEEAGLLLQALAAKTQADGLLAMTVTHVGRAHPVALFCTDPDAFSQWLLGPDDEPLPERKKS